MATITELPAAGYVTAQYVRERYSISKSTLYLWIVQARLPAPCRIGRRAIRFRVEDLRWFEESFEVTRAASDSVQDEPTNAG